VRPTALSSFLSKLSRGRAELASIRRARTEGGGRGGHATATRAEESPRIAPAPRQRPRREPCFNLLEESFLGNSRTRQAPHGESNFNAKTREWLARGFRRDTVLVPDRRRGRVLRLVVLPAITNDYQKLPITDASSAVNPEHHSHPPSHYESGQPFLGCKLRPRRSTSASSRGGRESVRGVTVTESVAAGRQLLRTVTVSDWRTVQSSVHA
jgi:hypothetical protein